MHVTGKLYMVTTISVQAVDEIVLIECCSNMKRLTDVLS